MYEHFLKSPTAKQWKKIGVRRRAGVIAPLFSIYSQQSIGIGEIPDLPLLADWCRRCGISLIQLLPLNDTGYKFTPYDSESGFALDPVYLRIDALAGVELKPLRKDLDRLRKRFPTGGARVDHQVKQAKLELLSKIFETVIPLKDADFKQYRKKHAYWLDGYAAFKVLKEKNAQCAWEEWSDARLGSGDAGRVEFFKWLQWQLFLQLKQAKADCAKRGVLLAGDLPFLVSRDSADVWGHPECFKLDVVAGAPPDLYFDQGQRWGMPPYDWPAIERTGFRYVAEKLRYAEHFYDLYRIDHFVGLFRLWTIRTSEPPEHHGKHGYFDPSDESLWEAHGRKILSAMLASTRMLPLAEDLGVVPDCSYRTLEEYAVCGMEIQRWAKHWKAEGQPYKMPEEYRENSVASVSTHDMESFIGWWQKDADDDERARFWAFAGLKGRPRAKATPLLLERALRRCNESRSIFAVQVWQDWLGSSARLNVPGTMSDENWSAVMPAALESLTTHKANKMIKALNQETGRI